jgi:hypothetical protein
MGNVLEKVKQEQVIALGRLGWSPRRIEAATGDVPPRFDRRQGELTFDPQKPLYPLSISPV